MMDREKALSKIKKCLNLSKSANENEAATALRQAQKLMAEMGIDEQDVELAKVGESRTKAGSNATPAWQAHLGNLIANAFGCELFLSSQFVPNRTRGAIRQTHYVFVGVAPAGDLAAYAFAVLQAQCARARMAHIGRQPKNCKPITKTARGDAFAIGWVAGVAGLVDHFANKSDHAALLALYMQKNYPDMGAAKVSRRDIGQNVRDDAYQGAKAAQGANLHRALNSGRGQQRITASTPGESA
jgi:hypothetical protein